MRKSAILSAVAIAVGLTAWMFLPLSNQQAAAQSGPYFVNLVSLDIAPESIDKFLEAAKELAAGTRKDPGCREFDIVVANNDPHHVVLFEIYDNAAALDAHRATEEFKKFVATTEHMMVKRELRQFSTVAVNLNWK